MVGQHEFERPRIGRTRPLTPTQRGVMRRLAEGQKLVDDCWGPRLEPSGLEVPRLTLRALVRAGLVDDPIPLFNTNAGRLTKYGAAWAYREFGAHK
jgi:hypothetical protein